MHSRSLPLLLLAFVALAATLAWPVDAAETLKIRVEAGETQIQIDGEIIVVNATEPVVLYLAVSEGVIAGSVEGAEGSTTAVVTVILLGDPDEVLFTGRVGRGTILREYFPHETGQGEM